MGKTVSARPRAHTTTGAAKQQPHEPPRPNSQQHQRIVCSSADNLHNPGQNNSQREPRRSNTNANRSRSAGTYASKRLSPIADQGQFARGGQNRSIHPNSDPRWNEMIGVALSSPTVDLFPVPPNTKIDPMCTKSAPAGLGKREVYSGTGRAHLCCSTAPSTVSSTISNTVTAKKPLQRKPSKWKKFGGLFRAKQVEYPQNEFFYQVQVNDKPLRPAKSPNFQPQVFVGNQYPSNSLDAINSTTSLDSRSQARQSNHQRHHRQRTANGSDPDDDRPLPPPRRATSPGPAKSPAFSLFPSTPTDKQSKILGSHCLPRQSPRQKRSNTHPSPQKALFDRWSRDTKRGLDSSRDLPPPFVPNAGESSDGSLYSPSSYDEESDKYPNPVRLHVNPPVKLVEPDWEMVTPAHKMGEPKQQKNRYPLLSPTPSVNLPGPGEQVNGAGFYSIQPPPQISAQTHNPIQRPPADSLRPETASSCPPKSSHQNNLSIDSLSDDLQNEIDTAQISIARSVSLSRGQKKILVPVGARTGFLRPGERFVEKSAGIPTQLAVQRGHRYEKSRNALIENA
ncbi:hypothetical protein McanMca71_007652 [Microsporum canis]